MPAPERCTKLPAPEHRAAALTIGAARHWGLAILSAAGIDSAGLDVRRLLAAALDLREAQLLARPECDVCSERAQRFAAFIERRRRREPVSRIIGAREFYGRSFAVSPATLDPRPESETLIETTLELVRQEGWTSAPLRILDVGTGTGCLILTLLSELRQATGLGTDLSEAALGVARNNAAGLGLTERVRWRATDLLENVDEQFHILVSNPPYLTTAELAAAEPEVRRFDPPLALDGGVDGLAIFRRLSKGIGKVVRSGWIVLEVGHDQADRVAEIMQPVAGGRLEELRFTRDVAGRRRCVAVRTRN
jgi:release factor glutamine methyltransferase